MSKEDAFPHFVEYSPKEAGVFKGFIQRAKRDNPMGAAVDVHKVSDYKNMRMFSTPDGLAGYAVNKEGESPNLETERKILAKNPFDEPKAPGKPDIVDWDKVLKNINLILKYKSIFIEFLKIF